jgi:hypothetical protein
MPRSKKPSGQAQRRFRDGLPAELQRPFDELVGHVATLPDGLRWYHQLGILVRRLRGAGGDTGPLRGAGGFKALSDAVGVADSLLRKAGRFVQLYPSKQELRAVAALGVDWTRLWLAFSIGDEEDRHAVLEKAVDQGWDQDTVRFEVQRRHPTGRRGMGGRKPKKAEGHGPEVTLRQLVLAGRNLLSLYEGAWSKIGRADWNRFLAGLSADEAAPFRELLRDAGKAMGTLAKASRQVRSLLADLLRSHEGGA